MIRKRTKMLFKIGLTFIITVAALVYYYADNNHENTVQTHVVADEKEATRVELVRKSKVVPSSRGDNLIHLCVVVCGDRKEEAITMIKSAILWPRRKLRIHIFAEDHLQQPMRDKFNIWPQEFRDKFDYIMYPITFPRHGDNWKQLFKPCSSQRLFLPALLADTDAILYVDTDVIFLRPIDDIWQHFSEFNASHMAALAPESQDLSTGWYNRFAAHPFYGQTGVNSGVMLMNLTRMRDFGWISLVMRYYREYKLRLTWGDQDLINIVFHYHPDKLYVYSCDWNYRPDHCMYMSVCEIAEHVGVSVLHGNRGVLHSNKQPVFRAIFDAFRDHRLGADVQYNLLDAMTKNLEDTINTNCGKVRQIFTKQFEKQIPDYRRRKLEWLMKHKNKLMMKGDSGNVWTNRDNMVSRSKTFTEIIEYQNVVKKR